MRATEDGLDEVRPTELRVAQVYPDEVRCSQVNLGVRMLASPGVHASTPLLRIARCSWLAIDYPQGEPTPVQGICCCSALGVQVAQHALFAGGLVPPQIDGGVEVFSP